jgi:ketosteroid isomerase-like protein
MVTRAHFRNGGRPKMLRITSIAILLISLLAVIPSQAQAKDTSDVDAVKQVELGMGDAMVAGDIAKLNQIYADDFATVSGGKVITKETLLTDFKSFHDKLEWFENGPMDVQVFGNIAVAQGGVREKRSQDGKDTSGEFAWMDLLEKRAGKWMVVRSAAATVVRADSPEAQLRDPTVVDTIKQFEQEIGDAMVAGNIEKLNQTYADDWVTIGSSGKIFTKDGLLDDFKSGKHKLVSFENGPMDVQLLGNVALVQASVHEKRIQDGHDISGEFVYMDLLEKRADKWVIVRTLGARLK